MVSVEIRPAALAQVKQLMQGQKPGVAIRVYAQPGGGGCGGGCGCGSGHAAVQFGMAFAKARQDDAVVRVGGLEFIVDPSSVPWVNGAVIDYVEDLKESGFRITNPTLPVPDAAGQAGGCGSCGSSSANGGGCGCG
ncbi:MAG: iron-sulfur cluster assembly accessory protein [Thermoplasmata archaeon]